MELSELHNIARTAATWPNAPRANAFRIILRRFAPVRTLRMTLAEVAQIREVFRSLSLLYC